MTAFATTDNDAYDAFFELSFSPNLSLIPMVRRFVFDFYVRVLGDEALTSRVVLAAHELLENAVTYSVDRQTSITIGIRRNEGVIDVAIETQNRCSAAHVEELTRRVGEITSAPDPFAHYIALMQRTSTQVEGSGLGLGRIRAEADMAVECRIESDIVYISARARYEQPLTAGSDAAATAGSQAPSSRVLADQPPAGTRPSRVLADQPPAGTLRTSTAKS